MAMWMILVAAIGSWVFGAIYYGVLGKFWADASEFTAGQRARIEGGPKTNPLPFVLSFLAEIVMALVLALLIRQTGAAGMGGAAILALTCWLGFVASTILTNNAYGLRRWSLTVIDSGHWLGVLLVQALILSALG
jgi:hypothetical protein